MLLNSSSQFGRTSCIWTCLSYIVRLFYSGILHLKWICYHLLFIFSDVLKGGHTPSIPALQLCPRCLGEKMLSLKVLRGFEQGMGFRTALWCRVSETWMSGRLCCWKSKCRLHLHLDGTWPRMLKVLMSVLDKSSSKLSCVSWNSFSGKF